MHRMFLHSLSKLKRCSVQGFRHCWGLRSALPMCEKVAGLQLQTDYSDTDLMERRLFSVCCTRQEKIAKLEAATETAQSVAAPAVTDFGWLNQVTRMNPLDPIPLWAVLQMCNGRPHVNDCHDNCLTSCARAVDGLFPSQGSETYASSTAPPSIKTIQSLHRQLLMGPIAPTK